MAELNEKITMADEPEKIAPKPVERSIFYPSLRFLFDWLLIINSFMFALMVSHVFQDDLLISVAVGINVFFIASWLILLRPLLKIVIENNAVTGPFKLFARKKYSSP